MSTELETEHEKEPLRPNQECVALQDFLGQEEGDLPFKNGERITIIEPGEVMFWYKARNESGQIGLVPRPLLVPLEDGPSPLLPPKTTPTQLSHNTDGPSLLLPPKPTPTQASSSGEGYVQMNPATMALPGVAGSLPGVPSQQGYLHLSPATFQQNSSDPADQKAFIAQEKEKRRRLKPGTLVMGICQFQGQEPGDLPFNVYEEMMIISPLPDLCWYSAHKTDHPEQKGNIPVTHVTLVYMSDDDDEFPEVSTPKVLHDMLYDDVNDYLSQSGWFSYPGLAHGKVALQHVLAKKCGMSHEQYMSTQEAVYRMTYRKDEKIFVGKANVLNEELSRHFDCFGKKKEEIRDIDDELCHHTEMAGWDITVWVLEPGEVLEVECAKRIIECGALVSKDGNGITQEMSFEHRSSFDQFWNWFAPK